MTYTRPEGKSGGHGVGWSEIPRYTFKVPQGWQESPVSIADLGGTEVGHSACTSDCSMAPYHKNTSYKCPCPAPCFLHRMRTWQEGPRSRSRSHRWIAPENLCTMKTLSMY